MFLSIYSYSSDDLKQRIRQCSRSVETRQKTDLDRLPKSVMEKLTSLSGGGSFEAQIPEAFNIDVIWTRMHEFMKHFCYNFILDGSSYRFPFQTRRDSNDFFDLVEQLKFHQDVKDLDLFEKFMRISLSAEENVRHNIIRSDFNKIVFPNSNKEIPYTKGLLEVEKYLEKTRPLPPLEERLANLRIVIPPAYEDNLEIQGLSSIKL